jgi:hypothetical protein
LRFTRKAPGRRLFLAAALAFAAWPLPARAEISKEYQVKAVFLFNFAQFVTWPPDTFTRPDEPFRIGILGEDPFGSYLDQTVRGENVNGNPLVIKRCASVAEARDCQILFISRSEMGNLDGIFASLQGRSILTVGDAQDFIHRGGVLRFDLVDNKVHLRISLKAAKRAKLEISSKILRLAEIVDRGGE